MSNFTVEVIRMRYKYGHDGFMPLTSAIHLHTAALEERPILVFAGGELVGSGKIEKITENAVHINGERYLRANNTFAYAK